MTAFEYPASDHFLVVTWLRRPKGQPNGKFGEQAMAFFRFKFSSFFNCLRSVSWIF